MPRPTTEDVAYGYSYVRSLAYDYDQQNNPNGWTDLLRLLALHSWLDDDYRIARRSAAWPPGGPRSPEGGGTIAGTIGHHGLSRPTEARFILPESGGILLRDRHVKDLADLRREQNHKLGQLVDAFQNALRDKAGWPYHVQDAG
jgi:hypothetical protein